MDGAVKPHVPLNLNLTGAKLSPFKPGQTVINLSKTFILSVSQYSLLNKSLSFIPTCTLGRDIKKQYKCDLQGYHRRIKLVDFFKNNKDISKPFINPSDWIPPPDTIPLHIQELISQDVQTVKDNYKRTTETSNLSHGERQALKELQNDTSIVIKPADKGSSVVILDREQYIFEVERQLNDSAYYRKLDNPIYLDTIKPVTHIIDSLLRSKYINDKQHKYLIGEDEPKPRRFYILPKIHKDPTTWTIPFKIPPGRPIVSDCGSETYYTAEFLDHFLNPLSTKHPSYIKDTYHFVETIKSLKVPHECLLFSMDVKSLYTNIPIVDGILCIKNTLDKFPDPTRPDRQILQLLDINLTKNDFVFNNQFYLQIKGTAMGKKFAPAYANIYMAQWEEEVFSKCQIKPLKYFRYLDDIWGIWPGSHTEFLQFMSTLNSHNPSIQLTYEINNTTIDFLDTTTYKGQDFLSTSILDIKVFFKGTDTHALLFKDSFHPNHTYEGLVKSQILRFNRICTNKIDFKEATRILFQALLNRGYCRTFLRRCYKTYLNRKVIMGNQLKSIPLIITYTSIGTTLSKMLKSNFNNLLYKHKPFDQHKIIVAYRRNKNLKDLLVRALFSPLNQRVEPRDLNLQFTKLQFIKNHINNHWFQITQQFTPISYNCIYLIHCSHCPILFVGETGITLSIRIRQHSLDINNNKYPDLPLIQHFRTFGLDAFRMSGLQGNITWTLDQRRKREDFWIHKLGAIAIRPHIPNPNDRPS